MASPDDTLLMPSIVCSYTLPSITRLFPFESITLSAVGVSAADPTTGSIVSYSFGTVNTTSGVETLVGTTASSSYVFTALGIGTFKLFYLAVDNYGASLKVSATLA